MTHRRFSSLVHVGGQNQNVPNVDMSPITSVDERQFLAGNLSPNEYLERGQRRAERWVRIESDSDFVGPTRRLLHLFSAFAAALYTALAAVFLFIDSRAAALASGLVGLAFVVGMNLYKAVRRGL